MKANASRGARFGLAALGLVLAVGWGLTTWGRRTAAPPARDTTAPSPGSPGRLAGRPPAADPAPASRGRPAPGTVIGRVVTRRGHPVAGARIRAEPHGDARSRGDGRFLLPGDVLRLRVSALGFETRELEVTPKGDGGARDLGDVALESSGLATVRVEESDGRPASEIEVAWAFPRVRHEVLNPRRNALHAEVGFHPLGRTDADGRLRGRVPGGRPIVFSASAGDARVLTESPAVDPGEEVRLILPRRVRLRVRALFEDDGQPISPLRVTRLDGPPNLRWSRPVDNPTGTVDLALTPGRYEIAVLAAGRYRSSREVELEEDAEISLVFPARQRLRVEVSGGGQPVPAFVLHVARGAPPPGAAGFLLFAGSAVRAEDGVATVELPVLGDVEKTESLWLLIASPGWGLRMQRIPWHARVRDQRVSMELEPAPQILGTHPAAWPSARGLRLYARRIPGWGVWAEHQAPRVDTHVGPPGTAFAFGTLGSGDYELRAFDGAREVRVGHVSVSGEDVRLGALEAPAALVVELQDDASRSDPPRLLRRLESTGWTVAPGHAVQDCLGVLSGSDLRFDALSPGEYALVRSDVGLSPLGIRAEGMEVDLEAGGETRVAWSTPGPVRELDIEVRLPEGHSVEDCSVGLLPASAPPTHLASLTWLPLDARGRARGSTPGSGEVLLLVADTSGRSSSRHGALVHPLHLETVDAGSSAPRVTLLRPARVRVQGAAGERIVLVHDALYRRFGHAIFLAPDEESPPLLPGSWRVSWYGVHGGHRGDATVRLGEAERRSIPRAP